MAPSWFIYREPIALDPPARARQPAHRPSRRPLVIEAAIGLFATVPVDEVTVQDIAGAVEMTPAAIYYHFASKEQILIEGMQQFRDLLLDELRTHLPIAREPGGIPTLVHELMAWTAKHRAQATVYFVSSIGLNLTVEALRRETRVEMIELLRSAVRSGRRRRGRAEAGVIAVALVSLLETSLASMLNQDAAYRALGSRRFTAEVASIAQRMVGLDRRS
jgi:AcrR family transcriptional regulator